MLHHICMLCGHGLAESHACCSRSTISLVHSNRAGVPPQALPNLRRQCAGPLLPHPSPCKCSQNSLLLYQIACNCNKLVLLCLYRLGKIDDRPSYHSQTQLWPVGYQATWQDAAAGTFLCDILDGGEEGPLFAVSLMPPQAEQPAHVSYSTFNVQCQECPGTCAIQLYSYTRDTHTVRHCT